MRDMEAEDAFKTHTWRRLRIPDVIRLFQKYQDEVGPEWGNLHIVLADGNCRRHSIQFCMDMCRKKGDDFGERLCRILWDMSFSQRKRLPNKVRDWCKLARTAKESGI